MKKQLFIAAVAALCNVLAAGAQTPKFEVASVKPNTSGDNRVSIGIQPGGRLTTINVPLRELIRDAYQVQPFQIVGGPDWISTERFDITAKAEGDVAPTAPFGPANPLMLMLRSLLEERFHLKVHNETREMPIYALVLANPGGKLGPELQVSSTDCAAMAGRRGGGPGGPGPGGPPPLNGRPMCGVRMAPGNLAAGGFPLASLANALSPMLQRIVLDRTGVTGNYDFSLKWTPDQMPAGGFGPQGGPPMPAIDPNGPSIFTAVQEQLGLRLESTKGPVEVLVIDSVERPTAD